MTLGFRVKALRINAILVLKLKSQGCRQILLEIKKRQVLTKEISQIQAKILKELLVDGRKTFTEIAQKTGLQKEIVSKEYRELIEIGVIKGATIHINYRGFGYKAVANLLINVDPSQADQLLEFVRKMPDIYAVYSYCPRGNIRVITTLRTLQQLDEVKDAIKSHFSILSMRSVIWTDVKEMHENLVLSKQTESTTETQTNHRVENKKMARLPSKEIQIDETDSKITEALSQDGLIPLDKIAEQIGTSISTIKKRFDRLKENRLLKVTIQIDPMTLGYRAIAIFYVTYALREDSFSTIERIRQIPDVISIMKTSGDYDLQVYAMIRDIDQLLSIQDEFAKITGVANVDMDITRMLDKWPTPKQYMSTF